MQKQIESMAADIHECSSATRIGDDAPMAILSGRKVAFGGCDGAVRQHAAEFTGLHHFGDAINNGIKTAVVGDSQTDICGVASSDHLLAFRNGHGHGFFAEYVFPSGCGSKGLWQVKVHWSCDVDGIDIGIGDQFRVRRVSALDVKRVAERMTGFRIAPTGSQ